MTSKSKYKSRLFENKIQIQILKMISHVNTGFSNPDLDLHPPLSGTPWLGDSVEILGPQFFLKPSSCNMPNLNDSIGSLNPFCYFGPASSDQYKNVCSIINQGSLDVSLLRFSASCHSQLSSIHWFITVSARPLPCSTAFYHPRSAQLLVLYCFAKAR